MCFDLWIVFFSSRRRHTRFDCDWSSDVCSSDLTWEAVRPYIPFSAKNAEKLRQRFRDVTTSTIIGTGLTAAVQGLLVGVGFWIVHLPNAVFWGVVTMVFAILPVVGSGLVWGPGAIALLLRSEEHTS